MKLFIRFIFVGTVLWLAGCRTTGMPQKAPAEFEPDSVAAIAAERARAGDPGAAMLLYRSVLDEDPAHVPSLRGMEDIAAQTGDVVTTAHYYGRLQDTGALQSGDVLTLARAQAGAGDLDAAAATLQRGVATFGDDPELLAELGVVLARAGRGAEARHTLEAALAAGNAGVSVYRTLCDILFESGDYDAALPLLVASERWFPGDFHTNMRAGYIYYERGQYEEASEFYRNAVVARANSVDARVALARSYQNAGKIDAAIRSYDKALSLRGVGPEMEPVLLAQCNLLNQKKRFARSIELLEQAGASFEFTAGLRCALGMALAGDGRYDEAITAFRGALSDRQYGDLARGQIQKLEKLRR